jgi:hypothetical protein
MTLKEILVESNSDFTKDKVTVVLLQQFTKVDDRNQWRSRKITEVEA